MSDVSGYFEFMIWRHLAYVRCNGQANMHNSHLFKDLTETLLARGYDRYVIDLEHCETMDSTFMGVLVGITLYDGAAETPRVMVVNAQGLAARQLNSLGIAHLLQVKSDWVELPGDADFERIEERQFDPRRRLEMIEMAHRNLIEVNDRNEVIFGPLLANLTAELDG